MGKAVMKRIGFLFEKMCDFHHLFIFDSYATRKQKGTHKAIDRAQVFLRANRFYLKSDIAKYFYSIDHDILLDLIQRKIKDQKFIKVVEKIIRNGNQGLPIGNLTSQFFANVYLNPLDHFVKETLRVRCYVRYMDDFVIFSDTMPVLKSCLGQITGFLRENLKLELKTRGTCINTREHGLGFLGFRIFPSLKRIKQPNLNRISRNILNIRTDFNRGNMSEAAYAARMTAVFNHLSFADSFRLRCDMVAGGCRQGCLIDNE